MSEAQDKGTYICYVPWEPGKRALATLGRANAIIARYEAQGMDMTLRQLHYQMIDNIDYPNTLASYNHLKEVISKGRLGGLVSWTAIEDRGRNLRGLQTQDSPRKAIESVAETYRRDLWADQPWCPEVWIEKEAGVGVIAGICNTLRVDYFACKGYNSQSEMWRAANRFSGMIRKGQRPMVVHIGDLDPSGWDMTRDIRDRLETFCGTPVMVQRIALNMNQVEELRLAPNPAKESDKGRIDAFRAEFGDSSYELDALPPERLQAMIKDAVDRIRHEPTWDTSLEQEMSELRHMKQLAEEMGT